MQTKTTVLSLPEEEFVNPGTRACAGCGLGIAYRIALKALGRNTILVVPPSCLTVLQGLYPVAATKLPCLNVTFASTAAASTGMLAALRALGRQDIKVVAWAGDGERRTSASRRSRARQSAATISCSSAMTTRAT